MPSRWPSPCSSASCSAPPSRDQSPWYGAYQECRSVAHVRPCRRRGHRSRGDRLVRRARARPWSGGRVIVVDKGPAPGAGSTSSSSSIIRFSYSTLDAVLTAWESAALWNDWEGHLGVVDPDGMARFVRTGMLIFHTPGYNTERIEQLWDEVGIAYERLDTAALHRRFPGARHRRSTSRRSASTTRAFADDADQRDDRRSRVESRASSTTRCSSAHNLAHAARQHGAEFRFHQRGRRRRAGRRPRVRGAPRRRRRVHAPVVVNVGGPHSSGINRLAGVADGMRIAAPAAAPGGVHRARRRGVCASRTASPRWPTSTSASTSGRRSAARGWSVAPSRSATSCTGSTTPTTSTSTRRSSSSRWR